MTAWVCVVKGREDAALTPVPLSLNKTEKVAGKSTSGEEN